MLAAGLACLVFSCSKDKSYEPDKDKPLKDSTFQPVSAGSSWHYLDTLQGDFTLTSTDRDTLIDGVNFHIFDSKPDTSSTVTAAYFGKQGISYYGRGIVAELSDISLLYLKDTTVNSSWSQTVQVTVPVLGAISATVTSKLTEANVTRTVRGKAYSNVSHVSFSVGIRSPLPVTYAQGDWYAARGVGLLEMHILSQGSVVGSLYLTDYTIK
jgi:hypothetical protein